MYTIVRQVQIAFSSYLSGRGAAIAKGLASTARLPARGASSFELHLQKALGTQLT
jgi:hypothetical protein